MSVVLEARGLTVGYDGLAVARDLEIAVSAGRVLVMLGPNGAGKTTTLLTLAGALRPLAGDIRFGTSTAMGPLHRRVRSGLGFVRDERGTVAQLTVDEHLRLCGGDPGHALELFPELAPHRKRRAGLLSGGQQKMLALATTLSRRPQVLLADELSLGLAPLLVDRLLEAIRAAANGGVGVLLVEQHAHQALAIADDVVLLETGRIRVAGPLAEVSEKLEEVLAGGYMTGAPSARTAGE